MQFKSETLIGNSSGQAHYLLKLAPITAGSFLRLINTNASAISFRITWTDLKVSFFYFSYEMDLIYIVSFFF